MFETGNRKQETGNRKQETGNRKQETGNRKITSDAFSALAISALPDVGAKPDAAIRIARSIHPVVSSNVVSSNTDRIRAQNKGPPRAVCAGDVNVKMAF